MSSEGSRQKAAGRKQRAVWPAAVCLLATAFCALFPLGWLGEVWPALGRWLGWVFATAWAHAAGHMLIFLCLGLAALSVFPGLRARPRTYFAWMCMAAVSQETFQLLYKRRWPVFDDVRDVLTDLIGLALAFALVRYLFPALKPAS